jgi:hypothetical protein
MSGRNGWPPTPTSSSRQPTSVTIVAGGISSGIRILPTSSPFRYSFAHCSQTCVVRLLIPNCRGIRCVPTLQDGSSWGRLDLEPAGDDQLFVSGRADVIQLIDEANNVSSSMKPDDWRPLRGCFYRGQVVQHPPPPPNQQAGAAAPGRDSKVVLSLCHGLVNLERPPPTKPTKPPTQSNNPTAGRQKVKEAKRTI